MYRFLCNTVRRMERDERGNVFVLFGASIIPLLLIMGGAVDIARYARYKAELANAVDAAALALAKQHDDYTTAQATTFVTDYVNSFNVADSSFTIPTINVTTVTNGFHVSAVGSMKTIFLPLGKLTKSGTGLATLDAIITAEVVNSSNRVELALVLDNTGSMNCGSTVSSSCTGNWSSPSSSSRIVALKTAANKLVDILMAGTSPDPDLVKIAVVPFEGTVNSGYDQNNVPSWLDWADAASASWTGVNFGKRDTGTGAACTFGSNCKYIGHKWLFQKLNAKSSSVKWEGCVMMRAEPYDVLDTTPTSGTPDTLFTPFFWPDEPDNSTTGSSSPNTKQNASYSSGWWSGTYPFQNDYLKDKVNFAYNASGAQKSWEKYFPSGSASNITFQSGAPDTSFPFEDGPNYGCPRPIVPLTNVKATVTTALNNMVAYPAMGTFIPTGLAWGWHVLSPTEPFTQGVGPSSDYYDKTVKAIVLLSDGENSVTGVSNPNNSIFNAYNYVNTTSATGDYHLDSSNATTAQTNLNTRTSTLCTNVKAADIRLYTITFGSIPSSAQTLMSNCASVVDGQTLYYHAPGNSELEDIFEEIGQDLADIHLSM
jgi:Flp pilus assembly protein TadG